MRNNFFVLIGIFLCSVAINVSAADKQVNAFIKIYTSLCLKHINNLEPLKNKLNNLQKLPENKASMFLSGKKGSAWPVPNENGTYVIALPEGNNMCIVYARRADTKLTEKIFSEILSKAPSPLISKKNKNEYTNTRENGKTHTISYEWRIPNNNKSMLFMLTTASSKTANLQVMASASIITK